VVSSVLDIFRLWLYLLLLLSLFITIIVSMLHSASAVEFYLYPTVSTALIYLLKPKSNNDFITMYSTWSI